MAAAFLLVFQILSLQAASVSPEWHDCLHGACSGAHAPVPGDNNPDHGDPAAKPHVCAVVILQQGMFMEVPVVAPARMETAVGTVIPAPQKDLIPAAELSKSARAPPCI